MKEHLWHTFEKYFSWVLQIGHIAAVLTLVFHWIPSATTENAKELLAIKFLGWSVVILCFYLFFDNYRVIRHKEELRRLNEYKNGYALLNTAFSKVDSFLLQEGADFKPLMTEFCTILSSIYTSITGEHCHVSLKLILKDSVRKLPDGEDDQRVKTFARSSLDQDQRNQIDGAKNIQHWISLNTDFSEVLHNINSNKSLCFISNDLAKINGYTNTSYLYVEKNLNKEKYFDAQASYRFRRKNWVLGYRSTIVAPIFQNSLLVADKPNKPLCLGFLTVDCKKSKVFHDIDTKILLGAAEGIYYALDKSIEEKKNEISKNKTI